MDVEGQHGEGDHPGEAVRPVGPHSVEAAVLQVVGRRLDRRIPARGDERRVRFADVVGLGQAPLAGQRVVLEQLVEPHPVGGTVEAAIEA